ncbi:glycine zipper 2TM domain-containing protein [Caballeronia zhejiangensis]|uniref:glycine zipper 2TM domain-containing protein n=1 Tax=Caballeronia zhejiangensis TaxID=871203 RepID=UPI001FD09162|nr:glycine zipper 2TM domain-containing protein [Caballeronia zhejiangensis]
MNTNVTANISPRGHIHPLVAGAAVAVILASATGIAAMTGVLPASRAVTAPLAQTAPVASAPATSTKPYVEQTATQQAPGQPRLHHHRSAPAEQAPGYANGDTYQSQAQAAPRPIAVDPKVGKIVAINVVEESEPTTGLGAVGGAVAGGLLGNQVGGGRGRVLATIAGAAGGGLAGNGIEHAVRKGRSYQVQVRMQDGSYRNFNYPTQPPVQVGERVRVSGDSVSAS